jgi:eukaryotic-like serine/threonine-protein kinase
MPASPPQSSSQLAEKFAALWSAEEISDVFDFLDSHRDATARDKLGVLLVDQAERWRRDIAISVEEYLEQVEAVAGDQSLKLQLIVGEFLSAANGSHPPRIDEYVTRFPELGQALTTELAHVMAKQSVKVRLDPTKKSHKNRNRTNRPARGVGESEVTDPSLPPRIGRYAVQKLLGSGGFGRVYRGYDEELDRPVAIKVPRHDRLATRDDQDEFIREARLVAQLDHKGIVPVYDVGRTSDGQCFVVSKFVDGSDLAARIALETLTPSTIAKIVVEAADALQFAHEKRIIHRDVKPANILLAKSGEVFVVDFGIALKEEDLRREAAVVGTLAYMSPEQIRGEGHLVDGRSDVFSLGVVLYEMLTGDRPFSGDRSQRMNSVEARPLRQLNNRVPRELERICLRAICKRAADRYASAKDFADDLRHWLGPISGKVATTEVVTIIATPPPSEAETNPLRIVPKGLRSFDVEDTESYLELIPGPRDRDHLPEILRFWKTRIESRDAEKTFRAGLIYGPSGCGKSSLLRAGLLPHLAPSVTVVFVEATSEGTEAQLLMKMRSACPSLAQVAGLPEILVRIRRGEGLPAGQKLLIVFDQFEQWLHSNVAKGDSELVEALRQCDGSRVQCLVGVRDDFWMGVTQFMRNLEVELAQDRNATPLELLSLRHARKVLIAFGRAFGTLPQCELSQEENQFIDDVVQNLAENERIIPVRLALFAEMIKDRTWHPEGIGVAFLENSFSSASALPDHRLHQRAARAVLRSLLPDGGETIKGDMRSREALLSASGYEQDPAAFEALLRILDNDLRLITPTESTASETEKQKSDQRSYKSRYYHLTHDYLVPPLREWLTRKQKETRRGRAEILLADRASLWNARPIRRSLPSFVEWLNILLFTTGRARQGTENQNLIRAATRFYIRRTAVLVVVLGIVTWSAVRISDQSRAQSLVNSLRHARTQDVPAIIAEMNSLRPMVDPLLRGQVEPANASDLATLNTAMALLPTDRSQEKAVFQKMLTASPKEFSTIRDILAHYGDHEKLVERLWNVLLDADSPNARRFRAGIALASIDPPLARAQLDRWETTGRFLAEQSIREMAADTTAVDSWVELLAPLHAVLDQGLRGIFVDSKRPQIDRHLAATVLSQFASQEPRELVDLILDADPDQYAILLSKLHGAGESARDVLRSDVKVQIPANGPAVDRRIPVRHWAHAAVALLEFGEKASFITALTSRDDPDLRTYTEDRASSVAARPDLLLEQLLQNNDPSLRAPLLRCLAGMPPDKLPMELVGQLSSIAEQLFRKGSDAGVHSAAEWALRSWKLDQRLSDMKKKMSSDGPVDGRRWYVNNSGQTLAVFTPSIKVQTGSPSDEPGRDWSDEAPALRTIDREFAIATTEVSVEDFKTCTPEFRHLKKKNDAMPTPDCPMGLMTWHRAAEYCNRLSKHENIPESQWCYKIVNNDAEPQPNYLHRTGYRLPTDVEWEFACRAGAKTAYSWGNDPLLASRFAWTIEHFRGRTYEVGTLCPNDFGLFDMHGNVAEWVQDQYRFQDNGQPLVKTGADTEESGWEQTEDTFRDVRGGSAYNHASDLRSANRSPTKARNGISVFFGFRVARTLSVVGTPK